MQVAAPLIVSGEEHRFLASEQLRETGIALGAALLEPVGRNTAPAVTLAALAATENGQDPVLVITPSDQTVTDLTQAHALLHGEEEMVFADSGYRGVEKREEIQEQHPDVDWQIAMTPGKRKALNKNKPGHALRDKLEKLKASIRAKVEHLFRVIKCQFGHSKARYRGLAKNTNQLLVMFALSNLWMVRKRILQGAQA